MTGVHWESGGGPIRSYQFYFIVYQISGPLTRGGRAGNAGENAPALRLLRRQDLLQLGVDPGDIRQRGLPVGEQVGEEGVQILLEPVRQQGAPLPGQGLSLIHI